MLRVLRRSAPRLIAVLVSALVASFGCTPRNIPVGSNLGGGGGGSTSTGVMVAGTDCPTDLGLTAAPLLTDVKATIDGSNVRIQMFPRGDALDYRVYALPDAADVMGDTIANATYRCAGNYEIPPVSNEDDPLMASAAIHTRVSTSVAGYVRSATDAQLGFVFTGPGAGLVPVYALGDSSIDADNDCYFQRYTESRIKRYTTSTSERTTMLDQHFRDDGIVFYVPANGAPGTQVVSRVDDLYVVPGAELDARVASGKTPVSAFSVYTAEQPGSEPLMRVYYDLICNARGHDELAVGTARYNKAYKQGNQPIPELFWSGLGQEATLVVEAVDQLCPFQGVLSPKSRPATLFDMQIPYPAFMTPDDLRAASATGEVYVNGQGSSGTPHAVARACVKVSPAARPAMDWTYDGAPETYSTEVQTTFQTWQFDSPTFDIAVDAVSTNEWAIGSLFGELWMTWGDNDAQTSGRVLATPKKRATLAADSFLHATMTVDLFSTDRRYPQLVLTDSASPVNTVIVETRGGSTTPIELQLQLCNGTVWDEGTQCPQWDLHKLGSGTQFLAPRVEITGLEGVDRTARIDVYASTNRIYVLTNGLPFGCADVPAGMLVTGTATVTFADVLFVSSQDFDVPWYPFHKAQMQYVGTHHFSNLGFSSQTSAPSWDETRLPCVPASGLK